MDKFLNEALFEVVLEKAFIEHEKEELKFYPDDRELAEKYPISKKEVRRLRNIVKEKEYGKKLIRVYFDKAAVVILCIISMFFALIMTSSEVRASVGNVILKWYEKYTEFVYTETSKGFVSKKIEDVDIEYIPENFELLFDEFYDDMRSVCFHNIQNDDLMLMIEIFDISQAAVFFDNEQLQYEKTSIGSCESWIMYNDIEEYGGVVIINDYLTVKITGYVAKSDLIKIAENIN